MNKLAVRNYIKTLSIFHTNPENEELGKEEWGEYYFDFNEVIEFNKSEKGYTTITLTTGNRWIIAIKFNDFINLIHIHCKEPPIEYIDQKANYEYNEQE